MPTLISGIIKETLKQTHFIFLAGALGMSSCATTQRGKFFEYSLVGALAGAAYGFSRSEFRSENTALFASQGAFIGAAIAAATDDSDKQIKDLEAKVKFFDESTRVSSLGESVSNKTYYEIPEEYRTLLESRNYEIYKINRWVQKGPKYLVKESEVIEFK